jgi:hypothetical protein
MGTWKQLKYILSIERNPGRGWLPITIKVPEPYDPEALKWLLSLKPVDKVGETILIFRTP